MDLKVVKGLKNNKVVAKHPKHGKLTIAGVTTLKECENITITPAEGAFGMYAEIVLDAKTVPTCKWAEEE